METLIDNKPAQIPDSMVRRGIFVVGTVCGLIYIGFMLLMKAFGLLHITELRAFNHIVLLVAAFIMIRRWITQTHHYVPFLKVVAASFFTGLWSFILFAVFLHVYALFDYELYTLLRLNTHETLATWPEFWVLFEGAGAAIVTSLLLMQYFRMYEDGHPYPENR
jgi:hypothetical protein